MAASGLQDSPFLRHLTSSAYLTEVKLREQALNTLKLYLQRKTPFAYEELMKLWKGLFYCMWLTANPLPQQRLAKDISSLIQAVSANNVLEFIKTFWRTMVREWADIDSHRINKYLLLCRFMLREAFLRLGNEGLASDWIDAHNAILLDTPLIPEDIRIPDGIRYHVIDIYVDEIEHAREHFGEDRLTDEVALAFLKPLQKIHSDSKTSPIRKRAAEALSDARLAEWGLQVAPKRTQAEEDEGVDEEDDFEGFD